MSSFCLSTVVCNIYPPLENKFFIQKKRVLSFYETDSFVGYLLFLLSFRNELLLNCVLQVTMNKTASKNHIISIYFKNLRNVNQKATFFLSLSFFLKKFSFLKEILHRQIWPNSPPSAETWTFLLQIEGFFHKEI